MPVLADDPRDLALGEDNDLLFVNGDLVFARGIAGIVQDCRTACRMAAEEWFLDLDVGIPLLGQILGQRRSIAIINARAAFERELLAVDGVLAIARLDFDFEPTTRTLIVTFSVTTSLGDTAPDTLTFSGAV